MATIAASAATSPITRAAHARRPSLRTVSSSPILGLPSIAKRGRVSCSMEGKPSSVKENNMGMNASLIVAVCAAAMSSGPALALVDERMTTEGTGLPLGLSNNILGWLLLGMFALIWSLYIVYTSTLEEDEESGLSL